MKVTVLRPPSGVCESSQGDKMEHLHVSLHRDEIVSRGAELKVSDSVTVLSLHIHVAGTSRLKQIKSHAGKTCGTPGHLFAPVVPGDDHPGDDHPGARARLKRCARRMRMPLSHC